MRGMYSLLLAKDRMLVRWVESSFGSSVVVKTVSQGLESNPPSGRLKLRRKSPRAWRRRKGSESRRPRQLED